MQSASSCGTTENSASPSASRTRTRDPMRTASCIIDSIPPANQRGAHGDGTVEERSAHHQRWPRAVSPMPGT
jgi:hypothetical protein